jgi:sortase A
MKKLATVISLLCLTATMTVSASALEYSFDAPSSPEYGKATSVEPVVTADGGETPNVDVSKNAALIPPAFGSPTSYLPGSGERLTPNLAGGAPTGSVSGSDSSLIPPAVSGSSSTTGTAVSNITATSTAAVSTGYTSVTSDLYYSGGYLATLSIPSLGVNVKVYEGTDSTILAKGAGHFEDTSIWDGNVCVAGHNRGVNCYFGEIHNLNVGDTITLTTKLGTRTYSVTSVSKISETDNTMLASTTENCITLFTCVRNESAYRWCVRAAAVS